MFKGITKNEYGTDVSQHTCDTCGRNFTVCPAQDAEAEGWDNCMAYECDSYDASRDADILLMSDEEIKKERDVVSMDMLRARKKGIICDETSV